MTGLGVAAIRAMTPEETLLLVEGLGEAAGEGADPAPPTEDEFDRLVARYG